jgi:uncharacterized protein involved in cysteine biosynthesis
MTAAVYRWLSDFCAYLLNASGAGLVAAWITGVLLLWILVWALATVGGKIPGWWRSLMAWHDRITLKHGPIPFDRRRK